MLKQQYSSLVSQRRSLTLFEEAYMEKTGYYCARIYIYIYERKRRKKGKPMFGTIKYNTEREHHFAFANTRAHSCASLVDVLQYTRHSAAHFPRFYCFANFHNGPVRSVARKFLWKV
jgi:hypothetical protein